MGLFRLLFWIAIILGALWLWKRLTRPRIPHQPGNDAQQEQTLTMVRCVECGTHVPEHQSCSHDGQHFCSPEHQARYQARH